ncbi:MAG: signal peptidase I [Planctomycetaceae bacterium]|nr:signal peptidase I [Planctomycetaceae bacterium]
MAPTLRGRHMDIVCPECRFEYNTGASIENRENGHRRGQVDQSTCPICHFTLDLEKNANPNERSFNGDRILVSKFAYGLSEPERWDVIVFKYPGNAKQNYIKRLVGLPGETLRIRHGDIHTIDADGNAQIIRKPPFKLKSMLHVFDDTDHVADSLKAVRWPSRWQQSTQVPEGHEWRFVEEESRYVIQQSSRDSWMRYRHYAPQREEWADILRGHRPHRIDESEGELITDYYCYNDSPSSWESTGSAWVGDLAVEANVEIQSDGGELLLDLVEGGTQYLCRIDIATGEATLSATRFEGIPQLFIDEVTGSTADKVTASTRIRGSGRHRIRFANCDDQVLLWIDEKVVAFDGPTTYKSPENIKPMWSKQDPGDMAPAGIGGNGASLSVKNLRMARDIYYLAQEADPAYNSEYEGRFGPYELEAVFNNPAEWDDSDAFASRRSVIYELGKDHFFPLGDNSPASKDARLWSQGNRRTGYHDPPPYVKRELLIGKALVVYWPHGWRPTSPAFANMTRDIAFIPNFPQMKLIR